MHVRVPDVPENQVLTGHCCFEAPPIIRQHLAVAEHWDSVVGPRFLKTAVDDRCVDKFWERMAELAKTLPVSRRHCKPGIVTEGLGCRETRVPLIDVNIALGFDQKSCGGAPRNLGTSVSE